MIDPKKFMSMVENSQKSGNNVSLLDSVRESHRACVEAEQESQKTQLDMLADTLAKIIKAKNKAKYDKFVQLVEKHYPDDSIKMFGVIKEKAARIARGEEDTQAEKAPAEEKETKKLSPEEAEKQAKPNDE